MTFVELPSPDFGPWYVDKSQIEAFRRLSNSSASTNVIEIVLRSGESIFVNDTPKTMEWLMSGPNGV